MHGCMELKPLFEEGLISKEEFETKKSSLLLLSEMYMQASQKTMVALLEYTKFFS